MLKMGLVAVLAVTACSGDSFKRRVTDRFTEPAPLPAIPDDSCLSAPYRQYLGQSEGVLAGLVFAQPVRIIGPDQAVTQDYNPTRINFDVDRAGDITRIWCG
jgi:hypothetical protein